MKVGPLIVFALANLSSLASASPFICRLAPGADPLALAAKYRLTLEDRSFGAPFFLYDIPGYEDTDAFRAVLLADPWVVWGEDDGDVEGITKTESKGGTIAAVGDPDALYKLNKDAFAQIDWSKEIANAAGRPVRLAVLDTGLSPYQPDLWKRVTASVNLVEPGEPTTDLPRNEDSDQDGEPDAATGHGTMVAGIVALVAPKVDLVVVRVADSDGLATAWRLIKGLAFAVEHEAEVANISLGSSNDIPALENVLDWAGEKGLIVVAPDGNDDSSQMLAPARYENVVAVAGLDASKHKARFSNWGQRTCSCAPSTGIRSYWWNGQLAIWSGTSFAAPFVSAAIADGLRKTDQTESENVRYALRHSGNSVDGLNPGFSKKLGTLLDFVKLELALEHPHDP